MPRKFVEEIAGRPAATFPIEYQTGNRTMALYLDSQDMRHANWGIVVYGPDNQVEYIDQKQGIPFDRNNTKRVEAEGMLMYHSYLAKAQKSSGVTTDQ